MANNTISQIQIGETTYDICDATARNAIGSDTVSGLAYRIKAFEDAIGVSNGTISLNSPNGVNASGSFGIFDTVIDRDGPNPSNNDVYNDTHCYNMYDKDGEMIGRVRCIQRANGKMSLQLVVWHEPVNGGTSKSNWFEVGVDRDGTMTYNMSSPTAFRNAIDVREVSRTQVNITRESVLTSDGLFGIFSNGVCATMVGASLKLTNAMANGTAFTIGTITNNKPPTIINAPISTSNASLSSGIYALAFPEGNINLYNYSGASIPTTQTLFFNATWAL